MNMLNIFLNGLMTALFAIVVSALLDWIKGEPIKLSLKKIIIILFILSIFVLPLSYIQNPVPNLPSGIDKESTDIQAAWNNKGFALYKQGNYTGAANCYDEALKLDPNYVLAWSNKGDALKALHRDADAKRAYGNASKARGDP